MTFDGSALVTSEAAEYIFLMLNDLKEGRGGGLGAIRTRDQLMHAWRSVIVMIIWYPYGR
jgi:hypothetical protein